MKAAFSSCRALVMVSLILSGNTLAKQYFVSTTGSDSNPGTIDQPFATLLYAYSVVSAGDTVYIRGGIYPLAITLTFSKSGTELARYYLLLYPGEKAILDFSSMTTASTNRGIRLSGNYWHIAGLDIKGAGDNGMHISGSYNTIENCSFYENRDTGLQIGNGGAYNTILNCDSYYNADPTFENADGFAAKLDVGTGNYFYGCRAWQNADDGFDGYLRGADNIETKLENCWIFKNGFDANGNATVLNGDGNGFKMGGGDNGNSDSLKHNILIVNCLAFDNRVRGFDQNNNRGSMTLHNNTSFRNGINYSISGVLAYGKQATIVNSISFNPLNASVSLANHVVQQTNSWMSPFVVTGGDFIAVDTTGVRGQRKPDGSLPDLTFMRLTAGSDLIDAGTDVGLSFVGLAPDLGAFEFIPVTSITSSEPIQLSSLSAQNYPNPFNPQTSIQFQIPEAGYVMVTIYNILGQVTQESFNGELTAGTHTVRWDGTDSHRRSVPTGIYFAVINNGSQRISLKLVLTR